MTNAHLHEHVFSLQPFPVYFQKKLNKNANSVKINKTNTFKIYKQYASNLGEMNGLKENPKHKSAHLSCTLI